MLVDADNIISRRQPAFPKISCCQSAVVGAGVPMEVLSTKTLLPTGSITREVWRNVFRWVGGRNSSYGGPNDPQSDRCSGSAAKGRRSILAAGPRLHTAPATGNYTFWIGSDDHSEIWLSSDHVSVAWAKPGDPTDAPSEIVPGSVLSPFIAGGGPSPTPSPTPMPISTPTYA